MRAISVRNRWIESIYANTSDDSRPRSRHVLSRCAERDNAPESAIYPGGGTLKTAQESTIRRAEIITGVAVTAAPLSPLDLNPEESNYGGACY